MKKLFPFLSALPLLLTGCGAEGNSVNLWPVILAVLAVLLGAFGLLRTRAWKAYNRRRARKGRKPVGLDPMTWVVYILAAALLLGAVFSAVGREEKPVETKPVESTDETGQTEHVSLFVPRKTEKSDPENWGIRWEVFANGTFTHNYSRPDPITFSVSGDYFALEGIPTFRGDNLRNNAAFGTADIVEKKINLSWSADSTNLPGGIWEGSGWTGQPLVVRWEESTRKLLKRNPEKLNKEGLVEVIYATLDGHIYFLDLADGKPTRDPVNIGMCFKGSGSLDPRGYPLLYVGSGDENVEGKRPRLFVISLIDGSVLYEYGHEEALAYRQDNDRWCAFDSSPLVDAETDTLIWPGENGLLYTFKLNSKFDKTAGTVSVSPDKPVCARYLAARSNQQNYWLGFEASASIVENYLYVSENGGLFYCVDLNTMELVWAQDTRDDSNSSPVFQWISETEGYIYTAPSLHWTQDIHAQGSISIFKLDALTGEILWEKPFQVHTVSGVSGGVQSTGLLGKAGTNLENLVFYTVSRTPNRESGVLVALDTATGEAVWTMNMAAYTWSSPVALYTEKNVGYLVVCDTAGNAMLLDGRTGEVLSKTNLGGLVEASPVAFENMLVVGTRGKKICGLKVS